MVAAPSQWHKVLLCRRTGSGETGSVLCLSCSSSQSPPPYVPHWGEFLASHPSSWPQSRLWAPSGTFGKELSSEYKLPLCLRSPTILKDSVAFKNSLKIGVGFFSSAPLWRSLLSPMLGHSWNSSCVPAPLGWAYSSLQFNYLVAFWPQLSEELEKSYNCVDFLFSHCALWRSKS